MDDNRDILTLDSRTVASNPGRVRVMPFVLIKYIYKPIYLLIALLFSLAFAWDVSWLWGGFAFIILLLVNIFYWRRQKEHFKYGDSNGAIVISEKPKMIAVTTNLSKGFGGKFPVIKVLPYKGKGKLNDRIGTVALYENSEEKPHWNNFFPVPVDYVNNNKEELKAVLESYSEESWEVLKNRIKQLKQPYREGLFKIFDETSSW
ncbi:MULTISPECIES: DUF3239 domain-containing protein [unclassified Chryseobacterium]|uniref:DUF3239 domain-containing protein n=1 Tax=unclassified Chryseobacterium TaxID=2593645 RepID=UPI001AE3C113|nr:MULTISPECIES: DUF3239 domain-containing protein [unclassified Chryseobacterium]MBP1167515.1 hypothetical protein [Chryseobacterium sp. PvR013]MDR4893158.1 DUF3239 domain-containing protein [Chryseobacterium sp. CFS7]